MDFYSLLYATEGVIDLTGTTLAFQNLLTEMGPGGPAEPREIKNPPTTLPEFFYKGFW